MKEIVIVFAIALFLLLIVGTLCKADASPSAAPSESWINSKLEIKIVRTVPRVFATDTIRKSECLAIFGGKILTRAEVLRLSQQQISNVLQIDDNFWILSSAAQYDPVNCINHSCNPNAGMKGQISLVAMHDIEAGQEITFDFAMVISEWIGMDPIACNCGAVDCRNIIGQDDWKDAKLQQKYKGYFSSYLEQKMQ